MRRSIGKLVAMLLLVLVTMVGCGGSDSITADTSCGDYLKHDQAERNDAAVRISTETDGVPSAGNRMWALSLDAACGSAPSMTLGEYFGRAAAQR